MSQKVLFVCLGNICRSPTAEAVFTARAFQAGLDVSVDSAGTSNWHIGNPPDARAQAEGAKRGYDLSPLRARQVAQSDFTEFDWIVGMDDSNMSDLADVAPRNPRAQLVKFTDFATGTGADHVPDPYYTGGFDTVLDLIETASDGLIARLISTG